ncbi:hypothetical protein JR334_12040 [Clostridia bacterium]|nr:hypothetical protein JR334_12040 [Clostridia bacterium]
MGEKLDLVNEEMKLFEKLQVLVKEARESIKKHETWGKKQEERYSEMAQSAHDLHMMLKERGYEPKHHRYMYENREVPVENLEFYNHIHPVEDLIAFINDMDANNDPEDSTIGEKFKLKIYTRRWNHYDTYSLTRTVGGWDLEAIATYNSGNCDKKGDPFLYKVLDHDMVSYPYNIGDLLEWIWEKAYEGLEKNDVQKAINELGEWISLCEKNVPRGIFEELL